MQDISEAMVDALFAQVVPETTLLLTITAPGLNSPIRVTQHAQGLVSRSNTFNFFPFSFAWGGAGRDDLIRDATLEIGNVDGVIAQAIRTVTGTPSVTVECVRVAAPDAVEIAMVGANLVDATVQDPKVSATIRSRNFADEPACAARYVLARTPSLA